MSKAQRDSRRRIIAGLSVEEGKKTLSQQIIEGKSRPGGSQDPNPDRPDTDAPMSEEERWCLSKGDSGRGEGAAGPEETMPGDTISRRACIGAARPRA